MFVSYRTCARDTGDRCTFGAPTMHTGCPGYPLSRQGLAASPHGRSRHGSGLGRGEEGPHGHRCPVRGRVRARLQTLVPAPCCGSPPLVNVNGLEGGPGTPPRGCGQARRCFAKRLDGSWPSPRTASTRRRSDTVGASLPELAPEAFSVVSIHLTSGRSFFAKQPASQRPFATLPLRRLFLPGSIIRERSPPGWASGRPGRSTRAAAARSKCGPAAQGRWRGRGASASRPSGRPWAASRWRGVPRTAA